METAGILSLLLAILACVVGVRLHLRIRALERSLKLVFEVASAARHMAVDSLNGADHCWAGLSTIMRHLAARIPAEQWLLILEEVQNGKVQSDDH